jgi:hypothetical protein
MMERPNPPRRRSKELQDLYQRLRDIERAIRSVEELERIHRKPKIRPDLGDQEPTKDCRQPI